MRRVSLVLTGGSETLLTVCLLVDCCRWRKEGGREREEEYNW